MRSSRRGFLTTIAGAAASAYAAPPRRFIIDSHQHFSSAPDYFKRLADAYRPRNAMACVNGFARDFEAIRKASVDFPDVVIPYGRIHVDEPGALGELEKFASGGFKGVKMHSPRLNWDDPHYFPIYAKLEEKGLTALFHTGIGQHADRVHFTSMERMRPSYLDTLTRAFPKLYIQGAHLGNPWYEEAAEAARWGQRLYFDLTGSTLIKKKNPAVFRDYLWWEGPGLHTSPHSVYAFEKIVFGTDEPPENLDTVIARHEAVFNACAVPEASRKKIYGETMARILGVPVRS